MAFLKNLFGKAAPAGPLTGEGHLASDLWVDQPGAAARIADRARRGELSAAQAEGLLHFVERGYVVFRGGMSEAAIAGTLADVDRVWSERPADLAYAHSGALRSFAYADQERERRPSYRIADLHSHSAAALELYLDPSIFAWVRLLFAEEPVATQSLFFEYGSQQALHRDPVFVQTTPPSHLVAAWIALEDIGPDCGPLVYVPGTHRLPYHQFEPGEHRFDTSRYGEREAHAMAAFDRAQMERQGLQPVPFTCRRGDVLIWHASLLHGGSPVTDPSLTRRSFVVHFSTVATYKLRRQGIVELVPDESGGRVERPRILETERVLERDGCRGFDSPMRGYRPPRY